MKKLKDYLVESLPEIVTSASITLLLLVTILADIQLQLLK